MEVNPPTFTVFFRGFWDSNFLEDFGIIAGEVRWHGLIIFFMFFIKKMMIMVESATIVSYGELCWSEDQIIFVGGTKGGKTMIL